MRMADITTIRLKQNSEISDIVDEMQKTSETKINFEIPAEAIIFQDVINLKILQKKAEELGKEILISKVDVSEVVSQTSEAAERRGVEDKGNSSDSSVTSVSDETLPARPDKNILETNSETMAVSGEGVVEADTPVSGIVKKDTMVDLRSARPRKIIPPSYNPSAVSPAAYPPESVSDSSQKSAAEKLSNLEHPALKKFTAPRETFSLAERSARRAEKIAYAGTREHAHNYLKKSGRSSRLGSHSARILAVFLLLALLTVGFVLFMVLPKASVVVTMKTLSMEADQAFVAASASSAPPAGETTENFLPVESKEFQSQLEKTFSATGVKKLTEKAKGEIIILNECSTAAQTLVAGTRFLSRDGKAYTLDAGVNVPGFNKPDDVITAGQARAKVTATEPGEAFNIGPTSFTIPKLQETGSWKYNCLYAKSTVAMAGGSTKEVKIISQEDLNAANAEVTRLLRAENEKKIAETEQADVVMVYRDNSGAEVKLDSALTVGAQVDEFKVGGSIKQKNTWASRVEVEKMTENVLKNQAAKGTVEVVPQSLKFELQSVTLDSASGKISGSLHAEGKIVYKLNEEEVKKNLAGKKEGELAEYFKNQAGVSSVGATFWPFWVSKVPADPAKIHLTIDTKDTL